MWISPVKLVITNISPIGYVCGKFVYMPVVIHNIHTPQRKTYFSTTGSQRIPKTIPNNLSSGFQLSPLIAFSKVLIVCRISSFVSTSPEILSQA